MERGIGSGSTDQYVGKLEQAIAWHVRLAAPDATESTWQEFSQWLEADPANRAAFARVEEFDESFAIPIVTEDSGQGDVPLSTLNRSRLTTPASGVTTWAGASIAAAALVFFLTPTTTSLHTTTFSTKIGETRVVALSDGSRIELNTNTKITVESGGTSRHVNLLHGEAVFSVHHDRANPFVVTVGERELHDLGTVFDVIRNRSNITVAVAEGEVAVSPAGSKMRADMNTLSPGDRFDYDEKTGHMSLSRVNAPDMLAWRDGYLIYKNATLASLVDDLNRYFGTPVETSGAGVDSLRFSGILRLDTEDNVVARISRMLPVEVHRGAGGEIVLRPLAARH